MRLRMAACRWSRRRRWPRRRGDTRRAWVPGFCAESSAKLPTLCAIDVDPACVNDAFDQRPFAARALWLATFRSENAALRVTGRPKEKQPAVLDPDTISALTVWGDVR